MIVHNDKIKATTDEKVINRYIFIAIVIRDLFFEE